MYNKIIEKAEKEALEIKEAGLKKANLITEQIIKETTEKINQLLKEAEEKNNDLIKTKTAELEQTLKQNILSKQKELISQAFNETLNRLVSLDDNKLKQFVLTYMKKIDTDELLELQVNENDMSKYQRMFSSKNDNNLDILSKLLDKTSANMVLSSTHANIKGGFIVVAKYYDMDFSFEAILAELEEKLITEVSNILFRGEE